MCYIYGKLKVCGYMICFNVIHRGCEIFIIFRQAASIGKIKEEELKTDWLKRKNGAGNKQAIVAIQAGSDKIVMYKIMYQVMYHKMITYFSIVRCSHIKF